MTDQSDSDYGLLIDYLLGLCDEHDAQAVRERLKTDQQFRRLHDDLSHTFSALNLLPEHEPPADLVDKTLHRIAAERRTEALLAREELNRRTVLRPTFSLRELVVAASAILLLAVIIVPSLREAHIQARINRCASQAGQVGAGLLAYANENAGYLPTVNSPIQRWLPTDGQGAASNSGALFKLVRDQYAEPTAFQCPGVHHTGQAGFIVQAGMTDFPAERFIDYSYQHALPPSRLNILRPVFQAQARRMAIFADRTPLFARGSFRKDRLQRCNSENHQSRGQNVLYLDMHVDWADCAKVGVDDNNIYLVEGVKDYKGDEAPAGPTDSFLLPAYSAK